LERLLFFRDVTAFGSVPYRPRADAAESNDGDRRSLEHGEAGAAVEPLDAVEPGGRLRSFPPKR